MLDWFKNFKYTNEVIAALVGGAVGYIYGSSTKEDSCQCLPEGKKGKKKKNKHKHEEN